jgi:hypothetical protein
MQGLVAHPHRLTLSRLGAAFQLHFLGSAMPDSHLVRWILGIIRPDWIDHSCTPATPTRPYPHRGWKFLNSVGFRGTRA